MSGEGLIAEPRAVHASVGHARLKELMHRGTEFLGCDVAIMGGAMSWVSERNLVAAISNAGGFGVIACGAMSPELLYESPFTDLDGRGPEAMFSAERIGELIRLLDEVRSRASAEEVS